MIGHMICLWTWALDNAETGNLSAISTPVIADAAGWTGDPTIFVNALIQVGFLDVTPGGALVGNDSHLWPETIALHNWINYAGKLIARREADRTRKRVRRTSEGIPADVPRNSSATVPNRTVPNLSTCTYSYMAILRQIPGWQERGEGHVDGLLKWAKGKEIPDEIIERSAIGLSSVQEKTLRGYTNLVSALQRRINNGYDDPNKEQGNGGTPSPYRGGKAGERRPPTGQSSRPQGPKLGGYIRHTQAEWESYDPQGHGEYTGQPPG